MESWVGQGPIIHLSVFSTWTWSLLQCSRLHHLCNARPNGPALPISSKAKVWAIQLHLKRSFAITEIVVKVKVNQSIYSYVALHEHRLPQVALRGLFFLALDFERNTFQLNPLTDPRFRHKFNPQP